MLSYFFSPENRTVYEIMSKNVVEPERPHMTIWRRIACWVSKAKRARARSTTPTHKRARTHVRTHPRRNIIAFPRQR